MSIKKIPILVLSFFAPLLSTVGQESSQIPPIKGPLVELFGNKVSLGTYVDYLTSETDTTFTPAHWGDQGNGTYINPVLNADFSDPDAIRVGDTYYMIASDFHFLGMQILRSRDLVNWEYLTQIYSRFETPGWETNENYANGSWAPSIRYHDGKFYVFFCSPVDGLYMTCASSPEGPWSDLLLVHAEKGWEDPCPFWDEDGKAYLGHSRTGAGPIIIHRMSPDGTKLLDEGVEVYRGPVAEGTKFHKMNGYYYLSIPEGGVGGGNQVILRSASIYGPYDKRVVLEKGSTKINGPHQGAIVDTPDGEWFFMHFQQTPVLGRVVHLQPMFWEDGWPVIGVDIDRNGIGEPVFSWTVPGGPKDTISSKPSTDDDFSSEDLSPMWQFNHNPVPGKWSLTEKKGKLTLHSLKAENFKQARNSLTQKLFGYKGSATVLVDAKELEEGGKCGLGSMGTLMSTLGVKKENGRLSIYVEDVLGGESDCKPLKGSTVYLRFTYDAHKIQFQYYYSMDGRSWEKIGDPFQNVYGNWKGVRAAIFCYNTLKDGGKAYFDDFRLDFDDK